MNAEFFNALDELEKKIGASTETPALAEELYLAVRAAKREIVMRNPLINFNEIQDTVLENFIA